jgi:histidinol-phosphatase (PHP family)
VTHHDHHIHSTYSDGELLRRMLRAAEDVGLGGVGIADHCNVSTREPMIQARDRLGFNLDITHERRRRAIEGFREEYDFAIYDAVEVDYDPRDEAAIGAFLDDTPFDYAIGSVHHLEEVNVHVRDYFAGRPEAERRELVATYYDKLVDLVDSELFDIAAHPDLVERTPALRGLATQAQYERVAEAFASSRTVPELNVGRSLRGHGEVHPGGAFRETLVERGVPFVLGSDSHGPEELRQRTRFLRGFLEGRTLAVTTPV